MNVQPERLLRPMKGLKPIYLDHHATTPVDPRVAAVMVTAMTDQFGNPNSRGHVFGEEAAELINVAREQIASLVGAESEQVVLHHSSSAAATSVFASIVERRRSERPLRAGVSTVEHRAILDALEGHGNRIAQSWIQVDDKARISLVDVRSVLEQGCDLLCVMAANNEVGTIYPIEQIAQLATSYGVPLLVDATQAAGHVPIDVERSGISFLLLAAHKMYGPKGVAAVVVGRKMEAELLRKFEREEGTPNVPAIAGFGEACRLRAAEMATDCVRIGTLRDLLEAKLFAEVPGLVVNGDRSNRLAHNLHFSIPDAPNDAIVSRLSRSVALSTGAACRSGVDEPSHVLRAMRLPDDLQHGAIRIGLGRNTSEQDVRLGSDLIRLAVEDTRKAMNGLRA
jgi:cysteine desulfurase